MKLFLYIQPNAKKTEIIEEVLVDSMHYGIPGDKKIQVMKVKLQAPPVDGAANEALINFIAKKYNVPKSQISITKGEKSRYKVVEF